MKRPAVRPITIVDGDGHSRPSDSTQYRTAGWLDNNVIRRSLVTATEFARATPPTREGAVWAIWPTGIGTNCAIREVFAT